MNNIVVFVFILVCSDYYYGFDCDILCGYCLNNDVCNNKIG